MIRSLRHRLKFQVFAQVVLALIVFFVGLYGGNMIVDLTKNDMRTLSLVAVPHVLASGGGASASSAFAGGGSCGQ